MIGHEIFDMETERCPKCQAKTVITGRITAGDARAARNFVPSGMHLNMWSNGGISLNIGLIRACASCGHVWGHVKPEKLRDFVKTHGDELTKQYMVPHESDATDTASNPPEFLAATQAVTEIDALILSDKGSEATRRYRALSGVTWDQAIDIVRKWRELTRSHKLALFGWRTKETHKEGKTEQLDHPMRDHLLDG